MISVVVLLGVCGGVAGALFCAFGNNVAANSIWCISNALLIFHNVQNNDVYQTLLFLVYDLIAIYGVLRYGYKQSKAKNLVCS